MQQVSRDPPGHLAVPTYYQAYRHLYEGSVEFDGAELSIAGDAWIWRMLQDMTAFHIVEGAAPQAKMKQLRDALSCLCVDPTTHGLLNLLPHEVNVSSVRELFRRGDQLVLQGKFPGAGGARAMGTFRTFVYERAVAVDLAEEIDEQTIRFIPGAKVHSEPRALISDLTDVAGGRSQPPIGATPVDAAVKLRDAIKVRAQSDLERVREACITEMEIAADVRKRAISWQTREVPAALEKIVLASLRQKGHPERAFKNTQVSPEYRLIATLRAIDRLGYAKKDAPQYYVWNTEELVDILFEGHPTFKSRRKLEIAQHACPEEVFAAFHLIQTYAGWNFSSVMSITEDRMEFTEKSVIIQGFKEKTDDDTPEAELPLTDPGVAMAVELLKWNRQQLISLGHLDSRNQELWAIRRPKKSSQADHMFHPLQRLRDFQKRHQLPQYSLDQVRTQFLFVKSLSKGSIQAAQAHGGHQSVATTGRYVDNIIQERISSAMNLAFTKELESELIYIHKSKSRKLDELELTLLKPVGDGSSCIDPESPPVGRSKRPDGCDAQRCHTDGGCPNRRIVIDTSRIEEIVRTRHHYRATWQLAWQSNPERFIKLNLPGILFNEALYQVVATGPYASKVHRMAAQIDKEVRDAGISY